MAWGLTTFAKNGFQMFALSLRVHQLRRPDLLIAIPAWASMVTLVGLSVWGYTPATEIVPGPRDACDGGCGRRVLPRDHGRVHATLSGDVQARLEDALTANTTITTTMRIVGGFIPAA